MVMTRKTRKLASLLLLAATAPTAQASCESAEELGAVPLELVEPSGEPDASYAVYWNAELEWKPKADLAPTLGSEFDIMRCIPPGKWVFVGAGVVQNMTGSLGEGLAKAIAPEPPRATRSAAVSEFEIRSSNMYWRPMKGDLMLPRQQAIATRQRISPKEIFSYESLFVREKGNDFTAEISDKGRKAIASFVDRLRGLSGRIGVEVFSNRTGSREDLREDTQVRANIVARYISQSFGLRDDAVVSIGLGSSGMPSDNRPVPAWPAREISDGVIIRILPE
jgi:hypothetical protein